MSELSSVDERPARLPDAAPPAVATELIVCGDWLRSG